MRITGKTTAILLEAMADIGIRPEEILAPLGLDAAKLADPRNGTDWETFAAILEELSKRVGGRPEALRDIGSGS